MGTLSTPRVRKRVDNETKQKKDFGIMMERVIARFSCQTSGAILKTELDSRAGNLSFIKAVTSAIFISSLVIYFRGFVSCEG